jgi:hypothetical protein
LHLARCLHNRAFTDLSEGGRSDDVDWPVEGTHPLAGHYHDKAQFIAATFARFAGQAVPGGVKLEVTHLYVDGDTTIAELHSISKTKEGADFANDYCWVCRFEGDIIVEVRGHVDSMMVAYTHPPQRRSTRPKRH